MWFLWNPVTSKFIRLPPLLYKDGDSHDIGQCCLSSPPHDPNSILLVTRSKKPNFVFCRLDHKRKKSRWIEMSYAKKLKKLTDEDDILDSLTWCNGKVYAMGAGMDIIIQIDVVVKEKEVVISLLPLPEFPFPDYNGTFKLTSKTSTWEEIDDLKDAIFFVNIYDWSICYYPAIASELGGYVHILADNPHMIHSYHVKNKTVSLSYLPCPGLAKVTHMSLWECRLEGDCEEAKCTDHKEKVDNDDEMVIKPITDNAVESKYLNFRATCKRCHLAAPLIQWRSETALGKLQTYSLVCPWLMVLEDNRGIMHFTDPLFGDKYFMKTLPVSIKSNTQICCSSYGWLLFYTNNLGCLVFFNPFTSDVRQLPTARHLLENLCFSAPPTSPGCIVLGFTKPEEGHVYILKFGDPDPLWLKIDLDFDGDDPYAFYFPTFFGQDVYALCDEGKLVAFKEIMSEENFFWEDVADAPVCCEKIWRQYFLVKCHQRVILVTVGEFGGNVEVFELNDLTNEWKKIKCLGKHVLYICGATCLCIEPKTPKMQNKIYFPRLHSENEKIVFYSLETCKYHTFSGDNIEETFGLFFGTKRHRYPHAWIEPSWY
ncbi:hypothetical protein CTI12_AA005490 [Artemisia annua]|uniref:KIB1-4 beta-propeller domain-containing protein n=1 Tax=Artemisia annua TaxID=35608 RepID=A0A2U1PFT2_ARTAN|nr:hypothetical protein CTI12_AA005490 [Artemisia annua]